MKKERDVLILWQLDFYVMERHNIFRWLKKICQLSMDEIIAKGENCM